MLYFGATFVAQHLWL